MQGSAAGKVRQAGSATLNPHGPADNGCCDLLHLGRGSASGDQPLKTVSASPANGVRNLWAEVKCHWLGATLPA